MKPCISNHNTQHTHQISYFFQARDSVYKKRANTTNKHEEDYYYTLIICDY